MGQKIPEPIWQIVREGMPNVVESMNMTFSWAFVSRIIYGAVMSGIIGLGLSEKSRRRR